MDLQDYYARVNAIPTDANPAPQPMPAAADVSGIGPIQYAETPAERGQSWLARHLMSGGAGDIRNVAMALGPAAQAAGGLGQAAAMAQRAGLPAKAPAAMDAADQMFDPRMAAPLAQAGRIDPRLLLAAGMVGGPAVVLGPTIYDIIKRLQERNAEPAKK